MSTTSSTPARYNLWATHVDGSGAFVACYGDRATMEDICQSISHSNDSFYFQVLPDGGEPSDPQP